MLIVALALGLTFLAGAAGGALWVPAVASHIVLWAYLGYATSKVRYVEYFE